MRIFAEEPIKESGRHTNGTTQPPETTSAERYVMRQKRFRLDGRPHPGLRHHVAWLAHNLVAHPLLAIAPNRATAELHELTSQWLNNPWQSGRVRIIERTAPEINNRATWVLHNLVAHVAIGTVPCKATFAFHDWTAKIMKVPGWV